MKLSLICPIGAEKCVSKELDAFKVEPTSTDKGIVNCDVTEKVMCRLAYKSQTIERALLHITSFCANSIADMQKKFEKTKLPALLLNAKNFEARCIKKGELDISRQDIEAKVGESVIGLLKKEKSDCKVNLSSPEITLIAYVVDNQFIIGIDLSGIDISKREYKIFSTPTSIKGTIAANLLYFCNYKKKDVLLDPFLGDGVVAIEAGILSSGRSINYYRKDKLAIMSLFGSAEDLLDKEDDKMDMGKYPIFGFDAAYKYVDYGKKNAKIAGVEKAIKLSRTESERLDIKFDKDEVDKIITKVPEQTRNLSKQDVHKLWTELFYQADFVLKKKGVVGVVMRNKADIETVAKKYSFSIEQEQEVWMGEQKLYMLLFSK